MEFVQYSVEWCRGEIFEGRMLALFGLVVIVISLIYWKAGSTPFAKAMFIPLLVVGLLAATAGVSINFSNKARISAFSQAAQDEEDAFVLSEKQRTENFIKWYPYTMWSMSGLIVFGLALFLLKPTPNGRAIGLAVILIGFAVLFLDHFSEERAATYHSQIVAHLSEKHAVL